MQFRRDAHLHLSERLVILEIQQHGSVLQVSVAALQIVRIVVRVVVGWKGEKGELVGHSKM